MTTTTSWQPTASPLRWWVCLLLMQATVINYMDRIALNQMSKEIMTAFGLNNKEYSQLESIFSFAFAVARWVRASWWTG